MKILASLCNKVLYENCSAPRSFLVEIDTQAASVRPLTLIDQPPPLSTFGINGLTHDNKGRIIVATQSDQIPMVVWALDNDYNILDQREFGNCLDIHSICFKDKQLYIASTGTDAIIIYDFDSHTTQTYWQAPVPQEEEYQHLIETEQIKTIYDHAADNPDWKTVEKRDTVHLNSICVKDDTVYATITNSSPGQLWEEETAGVLIEPLSLQQYMNPINNPHSLYTYGNDFYFCASRDMKICSTNGQELFIGNGYIRGLQITEHHIVIGRSRARLVSYSKGHTVVYPPTMQGILVGDCAVLVYEWNGQDLASARMTHEISIDQYGREIFDLLIVGE